MNTEQSYQFIKNLYIKNGIKTTAFNAFGIRNEENQDKDVWNDFIGYFTDSGALKIFKGTTDPGIYWTEHPLNVNGCSHMCLGYQENIWIVGKHRGLYTALCNRWPAYRIKYWQDIDKKLVYANEAIQKGWAGMNLHHANDKMVSLSIGEWSAGCQVVLRIENFNDLITAATNSKQYYFSYFLFDKSQIAFYQDLLNDQTIS